MEINYKFYGINRLSWEAVGKWQIGMNEARLWEDLNVISSEMFITCLIHARHRGGCWEIIGEQDPQLTVQKERRSIPKK